MYSKQTVTIRNKIGSTHIRKNKNRLYNKRKMLLEIKMDIL